MGFQGKRWTPPCIRNLKKQPITGTGICGGLPAEGQSSRWGLCASAGQLFRDAAHLLRTASGAVSRDACASIRGAMVCIRNGDEPAS